MGQRLDRPASSITNGPATSTSGNNNNNNNNNTSAVTNSLSTTFSSSSSSSASSSSSSASVLNQANSARSSSNRHNNYPSNRSHHHHHRSNRQPRNSIPDQTISVPNTNNNNNTSATSISSVDILNMSPRTRFRHEMARRGYTNSSSDLFFRLFQFPAASSNNSSTASTSTITNSSNTENNNNANSTVATTNTTDAPAATSSSGGGVSGLSRFFNLGGGSNGRNTSSNQATDDLDSELSSDEDEPHWNHNLNSIARSLPFFFGMRDFKCFVCNKLIPADDVETHIMMCLTKPRLTYNDDVLTDDKGECIICFEILEKGQTIARLPCLCIYHKNCIDSWLARSQSCPGHPN